MTIQTMTWRTFLDDHCRRMKAEEKKAYLLSLGISKASLNRWRRGEDSPKAVHLERMLSLFSESQRQQFLALLRRDAKMWLLLPADVQNAHPLTLQSEEDGPISQFQLGMLDHFCLKMLRFQRDTPDRFWQVSSAVLREALTYLETHPQQTGLEIVIAKCMPPTKEGKVRSLRTLVGMGTPPWRGDLHAKDFFLGAESLAGYAVISRHGEMIPDFAEHHLHIPVHSIEQARSAAAFPIMRENCVAGALLVVSAQPQYFTQERLALIEIFADLIRLAFYDDESNFYPTTCIDLGLMPPLAVQRARFASFRQRVESEYHLMSRDDTSSMRELKWVEELVRMQMEDELLRIAGSEESVAI